MKNIETITKYERNTCICAFCGKEIGGNNMIAVHETSDTFTSGFTAHKGCAYEILQKNVKFENSIKGKSLK